MIIKFFYNFNLKDKLCFVVIFFSFFVIGFFDIVTIAAIPIVLSYIISPDALMGFIPDSSIKTYLFSHFINLNLTEKLIIFSFISILGFIIKNLIIYSIYYFETSFFKNLTIKYQKIVYLSYIKKSYSDFEKYSYSEIIRDYNFVLQAVGYLRSFLILFKETVIIGGIIITILIIEKDFLFYILLLLFLSFFIQKYLSSLVKNWGSKVASLKKEIFEIIRENYDLFLETKISNKDEYFFKSFQKKININENNAAKAKLIAYLYKPFFEIVFIIAILLCVLFMHHKNYSIEQMIPFVALLVFSGVRILPSISALFVNYNSIKFTEKPSMIIYEKINELKKIKYLNQKKKILSINFTNKIKIKNLNYKIKTTEILKNINIDINKNEKVAFVGKVGSGKTTTLKILSGLVTFEKGEIKIDNKLSLKPNQRFTWKNFSYFKQNAVLLNDTIKKNILFLHNVKFIQKNYNRLIENLGIKGNLLKNKKDLSKKVGFLGSKISGGQKQIIALARIFNRKNDIILLDEPTNNLDKRIKNKILNFLKHYSGTLIIVTHDNDILKICDKIYEFKNKKVFLKKKKHTQL
jgi:ABC-type bacteriocin/lantibiotic exporter with double-glycine peptidase domain